MPPWLMRRSSSSTTSAQAGWPRRKRICQRNRKIGGFGNFGAPDIGAARAAAQEEVAFAESLCNHPADTLIAVHRTFENGEVREAFRTLHPSGDRKPMRAFSFLEVEDEAPAANDELDLLALVRKEAP